MKTLSRKSLLGLTIGILSLSIPTLQADPFPTHTYPSDEKEGHELMSVTNTRTKLIRDLRQGHQQIEIALEKGAKAEALAETLRKQNIALKWQTITKKTQLDTMKQQAEENRKTVSESIWTKIKSWFKDIDVTKVATAIISGIVTIVVAIVGIL